MYDIEFVNSAEPAVDYSAAVLAECKSVAEKYTLKFEQDNADHFRGCDSEDIGGMIVYSCAGEVRAVYDYENCRGWLR